MSTNLNYKQVANVSRRTWDLDVYEQRAQERAKREDEGGKKRKSSKSSTQQVDETMAPVDVEAEKEEFQRAAKGAAGPEKSERAFLKARRSRVDVDSKVGSVEMVNPEAAATTSVGDVGSIKDGVTKTGVGWHCKVCDCFLRDSHTYLDHINGRKHQRNLGFSMRVERSSKDQVSSRLELLLQEEERDRSKAGWDEEEEDFIDVVKAKDEEAKRRKEERARQRKERRKQKKEAPVEEPKEEETPVEEQDEEGDAEEEEEAVDMAALMGFSGFGGSSKN
eukprot:Nitzschia sp. Nitz4//scaffold37_size175936//159877//160792//NITZ4_002068-RA/size175936-augustus-gene-0.13-mRNA-1//1//CDS//3329549854//1365//frame0